VSTHIQLMISIDAMSDWYLDGWL